MNSGLKTLGIYIHIPFCIRKCLYCDFLSFPEREEGQALYLDCLKKEIKAGAKECSGYAVDTIFIGGGTPTVVDPAAIAEIIDIIRDDYNLDKDAEITIECNPGTSDRRAFEVYLKAGINRLSIGLQSPKDEELKLLGRIHNREQFEKCYKDAVAAGFTNINVDLMSALPGQSTDSWIENLEYACGLKPKPTHISAYSLIIEEGTPFYDKYGEDETGLPSEDADRDMYHETEEILKKNGYHRYEISNYALDGRECLHNRRYWECREYIGFGLGAASYFAEKRFHNTRVMDEYTKLSHEGDFMSLRQEVEVLDEKAKMEEFMFMGLRLIEGVSVTEFESRFGKRLHEIYGSVIADLREKQLLEIEGDFVRLTNKGLDVSNYCMAEFLL